MLLKCGNYESEELEGFQVTGMMKRFWSACLENLIEVDRICKKYDIKYFMIYGSLLGAVRHNGFIPWDDDLDIAMLRNDYNRFMEVAKDELPSPLEIRHYGEDTSFYTTCIQNTYAPQIADEFMKRFHGCPYSSVLDIFPIDNLPDDEKDMSEFSDTYGLIKYLSQISDPAWNDEFIATHMWDRTVISDEDKEMAISHIEKKFDVEIPRDGNMHRALAMVANIYGQSYKDVDCKRCGYIKNMNLGTLDYGCLPREYFDEIIYVDFETLKVPIPKEYDKVLTILFGANWRTPIKSGVSRHDYPVYCHQADILKAVFERYDAQPPEYFYL